mgnify:CR=1 FL=1
MTDYIRKEIPQLKVTEQMRPTFCGWTAVRLDAARKNLPMRFAKRQVFMCRKARSTEKLANSFTHQPGDAREAGSRMAVNG